MESSFFPRTLKIWNELPESVTSSAVLWSFEQKLKKHLQITSLEPKIKRFKRILYNHGIRNCIHARLRIGCSGLNDHLYSHLHVIDTPNGSWGESSETVFHFFSSVNDLKMKESNCFKIFL